MQAMTLSIGNAGITYFAQSLVANELVSKLSGLVPPNRTLNVPDFNISGYGYSAQYSKIVINLSNAKLQNFKPAYQSVAQLNAGTPAGSEFQLKLAASSFSVQYAWAESYHKYSCISSGKFPSCGGYDDSGNYTYNPNIGLLSVGVTAAFQYNPSANTWTISTVGTPTSVSSNVTPNIPGQSVIQNEDQQCFSSSVSDTTANSISSIDFATPIDSLIPPLLTSIPASGQLGNGIVFEWEIGDSGLTFPNAAGISVGITGRVSYNGTYYQGQAPAILPVPPVPDPTDQHHLQAYVSAYEVNALNWAFFQAGLLKTTLMPGSIPDPNALKVKTYVPFVAQLKPYAAFSMQADLAPQEAPVCSFQQVWEFTQANIDALESKLPSDVWTLINQNMSGNAYTDVAALTSDLGDYGIDSSYYTIIENGTSAMGMVVTQSVQMTLTILTGDNPQPTIIFTVARTDILTDLALGIAGTAQTMQFTFQEVSSNATFTSSTIPKFPGQQMAGIWQAAGDPQYAQVLMALGKTGVPLPIMSGFQFTFSDATLSVQQGFVSILAQVEFRGSA
jgi:hypothetical protein